MSIDFEFTTITGDPKKFSDYNGNAMLIVNVASKCGYTPQYAGLEKLHELYEANGLKVVGFPCNQFGGQEPGTEADIMNFCTSNYGVKFDMMSKIDVKGAAQHPLYKWLTTTSTPAGDVKWNFEKFLVDRNGNVVARFESGVSPDSERMKRDIEKVLA